MNSNFSIYYCTDNQDIVNKFTQDFGTVGAKFQLFDANGANAIEQATAINVPILAFISDNFLKDENCMKDILPTFAELVRNNRIVVLVTTGKTVSEDGSVRIIPTQFERVSSVIQYMNYWQDQYLESRRMHNNGALSAERLNGIREISQQIGDFIRSLRDANYHYFENVVAKNYLLFSQMTGLPQPSEVSDYAAVETTISLQKVAIAPTFTEEIPVEIVIPTVQNIVENTLISTPAEVEIVKEIIEEKTVEIPDNQIVNNINKQGEDDELEAIIEQMPGMDLLRDRPALNDVSLHVPQIDEDDFFDEKPKTSSGSNVNQIIDEVMREEDEEEETSHFESNNNGKTSLQDIFKNDDDDDDDDDEFDFNEILNKPESNAIENDDDDDDDYEFETIPSSANLPEAEMPQMTENQNSVEIIDHEDDHEEIEEDDDEKDDEIENTEAIKENISVIEDTESAEENADNEQITEEENATLEIMKTEVEAQPDNLRLRLRYAVALAQLQNNWQAATKQTTFVLEKDPNNPDANYLLGEMAEVNNDTFLAQTYYEKVANVSPYYPSIYVKIATLSAANFPEQTKQTKKYFKKAIEADEANTTLLYSYATYLNEKGENAEKAIKYFQKTLKLEPDHSFANYDLALIYYGLGDRYAAQNFYEKAIVNNPEFKTAANDEVFKITPILSEERAQEAILAGAELDQEVVSFNNLVDSVPDSPLTNIEKPTFAEEISDAVAHTEPIELTKPVPPKTSPNPNAKIVLITGATSGIGRATAEILAKDGYNLILTGRREERLLEMTAHFNTAYSGTSKALVFDVQNLNEVENAVQSLDNEWINVNILLNNAGLGLGLSPIHEGDIRQWDTMIDTNIKGLLYMTRLIAPKMVENRSGHIINICSTAGKEAYPNGNVYCATKFAVDALTKSMRIDLHQHNIRVSQVAPGAVEETEFSLVRFEGDAARAEKVYQDFQALRASDVAEVLHFIISRPAHVNIQDVLLMGTQQASASIIDRSGR